MMYARGHAPLRSGGRNIAFSSPTVESSTTKHQRLDGEEWQEGRTFEVDSLGNCAAEPRHLHPLQKLHLT